jgi:hypothetical protein
MTVDPLDTDATTAGHQRSRCDAQETWMPQAAASRTSSRRSACRHRPTTPRRRDIQKEGAGRAAVRDRRPPGSLQAFQVFGH